MRLGYGVSDREDFCFHLRHTIPFLKRHRVAAEPSLCNRMAISRQNFVTVGTHELCLSPAAGNRESGVATCFCIHLSQVLTLKPCMAAGACEVFVALHSSQGMPAFIGQQPGFSEQKHWFQAPQQQLIATVLHIASHASVQ